jgi:aromatic ring-cleaving dioxygenase
LDKTTFLLKANIMTKTKRPVNIPKVYHAHVYFNDETLEFASNLCEKAGELFGLKVGRVHQKPIGPHPEWSCQITFPVKKFDAFIPWIDENRNELTVFVHALTGDDLKDHTDYAYWLGDSVVLDLSIFDSIQKELSR